MINEQLVLTPNAAANTNNPPMTFQPTKPFIMSQLQVAIGEGGIGEDEVLTLSETHERLDGSGAANEVIVNISSDAIQAFPRSTQPLISATYFLQSSVANSAASLIVSVIGHD